MKLSTGLLIGFLLIFSTGYATAQSASASPATNDVLKLAKGGVGDDVLLGFIQNEKALFRLSTDDILALKDAKVGSEVIKAMLNHDVAVTQTLAPAAPAPVVQAPPVVLDPNPTPSIVVVPGYGYRTYPWYYHRPYYRERGVMFWHW